MLAVENIDSVKEERWQKNTKSLKDGINYIYKNKCFYDIELEVKKRIFKCHRLILGARSPKFAEMLLKPNAPKKIVFDVVSELGMEILLRYIYTDEVGATEKNEILEAHRAAKIFGQEELEQITQELISNWEISSENVCSILNDVIDIEFLREQCMNFIKQNSEVVLKSKDFLNAEANTLRDIFKNGCFNDVSVSVLLPNGLSWGVSQFAHISGKKLEDYTYVRELFLSIDILGKLKIQDLPLAELITVMDEYPNLLTDSEYVQFSLHTKNSTKPLPAWCE